jgi:hypothetical protein
MQGAFSLVEVVNNCFAIMEIMVESHFRNFEEAKGNLKTSRSIVQNY